MRWFDLIQHMVIKANNLTEDFPLFEVNLDDVPEPAAPVVAVSCDNCVRAMLFMILPVEEG